MDKIKKILFIGFIFFIFNISIAKADLQVFENPKFSDISIYNPNILNGYNIKNKYQIGVYSNFYNNYNNLKDITAQKFCEIQNLSYKNSLLDLNSINKNSALFYPNDNGWWNYNTDIYFFQQIVCEDIVNQNQNGSGATIIVNNNSVGINKSVFTEEILTEIYKYEALIFLTLIFRRFIFRILKIIPKPKKHIL